ncbi:alpha/beta hydrolase family protein [Luteolibacter algae]|uniref:Alpha/beta hydrolase family protein n=1 Tax=Luteolibacter algae TaxID=454151 RepID=A0ABW5D9F9_9BACT
MNSHISNSSGEQLDVAFHGGTHQGVLVVLGHGVTGNKDRPLLKALADGLALKGWPCVRVSFSGNGRSEGRFEDSTITKEIDDLKAVLKTVPPEKRIAYIGHSMGGAVGVLTAAQGMCIQSLVSLAGMTHTAKFVEREFGDVIPDKGVMWEDENCPLSSKFVDDLKDIGSVLPAAGRILQPWLLIHGTADDVVPIEDSEDVFAAAKCEKKFLKIPDAGHSFDEESYPQIIEAIDGWLRKSFG